jgi:hypothetical protein
LQAFFTSLLFNNNFIRKFLFKYVSGVENLAHLVRLSSRLREVNPKDLFPRTFPLERNGMERRAEKRGRSGVQRSGVLIAVKKS